MSQKLIDALTSLDKDNDEHWTQDGLPRLDVLKATTGETVTRADISKVSKTFNRFNPVIESEQGEADETASETSEAETREATEEAAQTSNEPHVVSDEVKDDVKQHLSEAAQAELDLAQARKELSEAQARFKTAQEKADSFRRVAAREQQKIPPHLAIKAFQRSQQAQRAKEVGTLQAFKKLTEGATPEEAALMKQSLNDIL